MPSAAEAKFKLKPKTLEPVPAVVIPAAPPTAPAAPTVTAPPPVPKPAAAASSSTPPSFPVVAPAKLAPPPIPHVEVKKEIVAPIPPSAVAPRRAGGRRWLVPAIGAAVVVITGVVLYWPSHRPAPPPQLKKPVTTAAPKSAPPPAKSQPPVTSAASTTSPAGARPAAPASTGSSAAPTGIAHVPIDAINKAKSVTAAQAGGAAETDAVVAADTPNRAVNPAPKTIPPTTPQVAVTELAPGVSATTAADAEPQANSGFRTLVANLHVTGIAGGTAQRALINGRLFRKGEVVDPGLGVTFEGVQDDELVFKDRTGATVKRRY